MGEVNWYKVGAGSGEYATIQDAINTAAGANGGVIYIPDRGTPYTITDSIVVPFERGTSSYDPPRPIHLLGDGPGGSAGTSSANGTVITRPSLATFDMLRIERPFTTIENIALDGGSSIFGHGIAIGVQGTPTPTPTPGDEVGWYDISNVVLRRCIIRSAGARAIMVRGGTGATDPKVHRCSYYQCVFENNRSEDLVQIDPGCSQHAFLGCSFGVFVQRGIYLNACSSVTFCDCNIESSQSGSAPYLYAFDVNGCNVENCWFEEPEGDTVQPQWFMELGGSCNGWTISSSLFVRKNSSKRPQILRLGANGPCRGILLLNPLSVVRQGLPPATDLAHVEILNDASECVLIGGVVRALNPSVQYRGIEVASESLRVTCVGTNRRFRLPSFTDTDIGELLSSSFHRGDVTNIRGARNGTDLHAWSAGGQWVPLTINRYANSGTLDAELHRDRGTVAWVDDVGQLRVFNGAQWRTIGIE